MSIHLEERTLFKRLNLTLIFVIFVLTSIGLINLYSTTHGATSSTSSFSKVFIAQIIWLIGAWIVFFVFTFINYNFLIRHAYIVYLINLVALAMVPFIGKYYYGAQRWLDFGFFRYQPSETMKLAVIILMAKILPKRLSLGGLSLKHLIWPLIAALIPFALTAKQPDLGTALMILAVAISMILFIGIKRRILVVSILLGVIALPIVWNFGLKEYQKNRVLTFIDPGRDPQGAGYNSIQSKIAVGSGGPLGKGYMKGTQSQLQFLPERHTDFIFSALSEEFGFVGSILTIGLFFLLLHICVQTASESRNKEGALLVIGVVSLVFWHMFVNIGMVTGLLPIVGIPLPLISYGGSSLLTTMLALGLISSVSLRKYMF